jgi:hypothetical protein
MAKVQTLAHRNQLSGCTGSSEIGWTLGTALVWKIFPRFDDHSCENRENRCYFGYFRSPWPTFGHPNPWFNTVKSQLWMVKSPNVQHFLGHTLSHHIKKPTRRVRLVFWRHATWPGPCDASARGGRFPIGFFSHHPAIDLDVLKESWKKICSRGCIYIYIYIYMFLQ